MQTLEGRPAWLLFRRAKVNFYIAYFLLLLTSLSLGHVEEESANAELFKAFYGQKSNKADQRPGAALFLHLAKNVECWNFSTKTLLKAAGLNFGAKGKKLILSTVQAQFCYIYIIKLCLYCT